MDKIKILKELFWEYKWGSVKKKLNSHFVISRVLEMGTPEQYKVFKNKVGKKIIINF